MGRGRKLLLTSRGTSSRGKGNKVGMGVTVGRYEGMRVVVYYVTNSHSRSIHTSAILGDRVVQPTKTVE